jgi:chemotaxis protein methyltransferase CheR
MSIFSDLTLGSSESLAREINPITDKEFHSLRDLIKTRFGINLTEQKKSLVVGRLSGVLRRAGIDSFQEYFQQIVADQSGKLLSQLIDKISTNHTHFNRESDHYDFFTQTVMRTLLRNIPPRIWIAGCSSGEEAYNVAMLMLEQQQSLADLADPIILATDISSTALEKASRGVYSAENVTKLPAGMARKYFRKQPTGEMLVNQNVRKLISYKRLNLIRDSFPFRSAFDVIFCRNVMIYFDVATRRKLVAQFTQLLEVGGYFFIGHSETLGRDTPGLRYIRPAVYLRTAET